MMSSLFHNDSKSKDKDYNLQVQEVLRMSYCDAQNICDDVSKVISVCIQ